MGMFYNKLMESAPADVIQTPDIDEIGIDLDAVEKAVMGDDGIEAHRDEVEDAVEGVIGDPVEEATIIMYESEYNYNEIMKCIGMKELNEAACGRDFFMEANSENVNAFFEKVKKAIMSAFESITRLFSNVVTKMSQLVKSDKAFVEKHEDGIRKGAAIGKSIGTEFRINCAKIDYIDYKSGNLDLSEKCAKDLDANKKDASVSKMDICNAELKPFGITVSDNDNPAKALKENLEKYLINTEVTNYVPSVDDVIFTLKSENDIKSIKDGYKKVKEAYKSTLETIKKMRTNYNKKDDKESFVIITNYVSLLRYQKNVQHTVYAICMKAARRKRTDARRVANIWYRASTAKSKKIKGSTEEPKQESVFFADIV